MALSMASRNSGNSSGLVCKRWSTAVECSTPLRISGDRLLLLSWLPPLLAVVALLLLPEVSVFAVEEVIVGKIDENGALAPVGYCLMSATLITSQVVLRVLNSASSGFK